MELLRSCLSSMEGEEDMEKAYGEAYRSDLQEAEAVLCSIRAADGGLLSEPFHDVLLPHCGI